MTKRLFSVKISTGLPAKAASFPLISNYRKRADRSPLINKKTKADIRGHSKIKLLEDEIKLLTSYGLDVVYRLRFDGMKYDYISPAIEKLLGFTPEEMKRINFRSLLVETRIITDGMKKIESFDELEGRRRSGDVGKWQADYLIRTKSGGRIWVSDISHPWFDKNGKVIGSVGSLRDITDRVWTESRIREELQRIANSDAITGLPNKAAFFNELDRELRRINRLEIPVAILLLEIDRFNMIRKRYDRQISDILTLAISKVIKSSIRDTDLVSSLGNGEFAVILYDTTAKGAFLVAERARVNVQNHKFSLGSDNIAIQCSISAGIADAFPGQERTSSDLYKIAGSRLYIAKNTGRNQVSIDEIMQMH